MLKRHDTGLALCLCEHEPRVFRSSHGSTHEASSVRSSTADIQRQFKRRSTMAVHSAEARPRRRTAAFLHGHLAGLSPAHHVGSVLLAGSSSATPALQVVKGA